MRGTGSRARCGSISRCWSTRPELVVPCLLRRCTWLGEEFPPFAQRSAPPPDAAAVRGLARSWEASWSRPYLRSLRTPLVPLDGGVIEEYRSGAAGALWLTASHVGLGDDVAWERASGQRVTMAMPAARATRVAARARASPARLDRRMLPLPIDADARAAPARSSSATSSRSSPPASTSGYGEELAYRTY